MNKIYEFRLEQIDNGTDAVRGGRDTKFCVSTDLLQMNESCVSAKNNESQKFCNDENNESEKFRNRYRIPSARLRGYNYSKNGAYFVTICTKNREHFFGDIVDGRMHLSPLGNMANDCWRHIPDHFPYVFLGEWVIMPNHVHGIIVIDRNNADDLVETQNFASLQSNFSPRQSDCTFLPSNFTLLQQKTIGNRFGPQSQNLASIIRGFKIGVTKYARQNTDVFQVWQPRFHDHIIRDEGELNRISAYIVQNPLQWNSDDYCS